MTRQGISALLSLLIILGACGKEEMPSPAPGCSRILAVTKSARSPQGGIKRFVGQPLLSVEITAPAGAGCMDEEVAYIDTALPDTFYKMTLPRQAEQLYVVQVDAAHELRRKDYPTTELVTPITLKPGEKKLLIVTFNTTLFEPGTEGQAVLKELGWHISGKPFDPYYLTMHGSPIEGNVVSFNRTLMDICQAVEDKIEMLQMPLKGWTCDFLGTVDFLIYAPEDQKTCRMRVKDATGPEGIGYSIITPEQIKSAREVELKFDNSQPKCTHP